MAIFSHSHSEYRRVLIVVHHLAVDMVSWYALLEDLQTAYQQVSQHSVIKLPAKTSSFKHWAEKLSLYANSTLMTQEADYWLNQDWSAVKPLPIDYLAAENLEADTAEIEVGLSERETSTLLKDIGDVYRAQITEILLTALAYAIQKWSKTNLVLVSLEGHGREELFEDVDLSRTVGWFTTIYPVILKLPITNNIEETIKAVKEQLRGIPKRGIGYGLLRYLSKDPSIMKQISLFPEPEISFNYLGQMDQLLPEESLLRMANESSGEVHGLANKRRHSLEINGLIRDARLRFYWYYNTKIHQTATIKTVAEELINAMRTIISRSKSLESEAHTPSDFPLAKLDQRKLNKLSKLVGNKE